MNDSDRGTGRTTKQMRDAPRDAIFIWCNDRVEYPKHLAASLDRSDLQIVPPSWIVHGWIGRTLSGVVIDHAASLSRKQAAFLLEGTQTRIRAR